MTKIKFKYLPDIERAFLSQADNSFSRNLLSKIIFQTKTSWENKMTYSLILIKLFECFNKHCFKLE